MLARLAESHPPRVSRARVSKPFLGAPKKSFASIKSNLFSTDLLVGGCWVRFSAQSQLRRSVFPDRSSGTSKRDQLVIGQRLNPIASSRWRSSVLPKIGSQGVASPADSIADGVGKLANSRTSLGSSAGFNAPRPRNHQAALREAGESDLAPFKSLSLGNLAPKRVRICDARCLI